MHALSVSWLVHLVRNFSTYKEQNLLQGSNQTKKSIKQISDDLMMTGLKLNVAGTNLTFISPLTLSPHQSIQM